MEWVLFANHISKFFWHQKFCVREMKHNIDILAIGAHPDDVELGCGGTIAKHISQGQSVAIIDLTRGELGTRGSIEIRDLESRKAADILLVKDRFNLGLRDGWIENNEDSQLSLISFLRFFSIKAARNRCLILC